jgi:biotin carboxyl carrier protein
LNFTRKSSNSKIGLEEISFYYDEMVRSGLLELEVETPAGKIVLKRVGLDQGSKGPHPLRRKTDFLTTGEPPLPSTFKTILSPITGIFYRASSPQSPPLVKENDSVDAGTTLCIVEAMKVMNEIKSETRCRILKILGENGKPVTKGQPLFHVEPGA